MSVLSTELPHPCVPGILLCAGLTDGTKGPKGTLAMGERRTPPLYGDAHGRF